jgi:hypothetical protein
MLIFQQDPTSIQQTKELIESSVQLPDITKEQKAAIEKQLRVFLDSELRTKPTLEKRDSSLNFDVSSPEAASLLGTRKSDQLLKLFENNSEWKKLKEKANFKAFISKDMVPPSEI